MTFSSCLNNQYPALVLDSSVVINLLATGQSSAILQALNVPLIVTDQVVREIEQGATNGRPEFGMLQNALNGQILRVEEVNGQLLETFFDLISGSASNSLGDGEAATLAFAHGKGFAAAIDEKKATRIAAERFEMLPLVTTVDILAYAPVLAFLGAERLADATFSALKIARMQVRDYQFDWVVQLIGTDNANTCPSLRRHARRKSETLPG
jgi:predicted nucleic acid-binding protein